MDRLTVRNVRVMDPQSGRDEVADVLIEGGRVAAIDRFSPGVRSIDGRGLVAAPGFVDVHVHFRDPGLTYKEDLYTGAQAALAGGFTSVICMANTKPPIDTPEALEQVLARARRAPVRIFQAAAVTKGLSGEALTDMEALLRSGAACFTDDGSPIASAPLALAAFQEAARLQCVVSLHEEDPAFVWDAGVNAGEAARRLGLRGASASAEEVMVARDCMLALSAGARVHIQHVSSRLSVAIIRMARSLGAQVTAEATPHHFTLCEDAVDRFGANAKMNPPLRSRADREAIVEGLRDGTITVIATDHAPHAAREKERPFAQAPSGIIGLETSFALGVTGLVRTGALTLMELLRKMTCGPAEAFGLDAGILRVGGRADLVLVDPDEEWRVEHFLSKSQNSPFLGATLHGRVKYVIAGGIPYAVSARGVSAV